MGHLEDAKNPYLTLTETADSSVPTPDVGDRRFSIDPTDHLPRLKNSSATVAKLFHRVSSGTAVIASGNTSVVVTHGVGASPAATDITVTPTNNPTNDPGNVWVDTIGPTTFTINCRADPGVSTMTFSWHIDQ